MSEIDLTKQVQQCEIDILRQIDVICSRHGLKYFAIGGTALGAVRHQGFIPWDDDIDIGMPRKDYEEFLSVAERELPPGYLVQNFSTEPNTPFYFTKIRRENTRFVEYYLKDFPIHQGIFVDIFPFDSVPQNKWIEKLHFRFCRILYQLFLCKSLTTVCSSRFRDDKSEKKARIRRAIHVLLRPIPKQWLFFALDKSVQRFNDKTCSQISHIVRRRLRVNLTDLYPISRLPFDGIEMPVPRNWDAYLSAQFGDYRVLPPEDKRYGHLPWEIKV